MCAVYFTAVDSANKLFDTTAFDIYMSIAVLSFICVHLPRCNKFISFLPYLHKTSNIVQLPGFRIGMMKSEAVAYWPRPTRKRFYDNHVYLSVSLSVCLAVCLSIYLCLSADFRRCKRPDRETDWRLPQEPAKNYRPVFMNEQHYLTVLHRNIL